MIINKLGRITYQEGLELQLAARSRVLEGGDDELLVLEHEPVVTLGRRGGEVQRARLEAMDVPVIQTDRGGLATWHGPGQLVIYPVVNLPRMGATVPSFVQRLGEVMEQACWTLGAPEAHYDCARPGVYVDGSKVGAIGLHIHRGITTHGLALNANCSLEGFQSIVPCGLAGVGVTTLSLLCGRDIDVVELADLILDHWSGAG